ncbi:MAG: type II toxin-antitoxin system Phd/YefM family antitoxin [Firmicutes bacterium]|nr:type II toxin-antitoxin system Phd/YefM family antitoxin [Bacillota bacterium]
MPKIIPIKDLKNTSQISEMCHIAEEPIYITKNGYGDMVIMSVELYEMTMKKLNMYHQLELSENQIDTGKTTDARESLDNLRKKYAL